MIKYVDPSESSYAADRLARMQKAGRPSSESFRLVKFEAERPISKEKRQEGLEWLSKIKSMPALNSEDLRAADTQKTEDVKVEKPVTFVKRRRGPINIAAILGFGRKQ